ncbi:hypothetical protein [Staphylococcus kloosii]|nr:hypothetical protein [Staphylococcus kloosii]
MGFFANASIEAEYLSTLNKEEKKIYMTKDKSEKKRDYRPIQKR